MRALVCKYAVVVLKGLCIRLLPDYPMCHFIPFQYPLSNIQTPTFNIQDRRLEVRLNHEDLNTHQPEMMYIYSRYTCILIIIT